MPSAMVLAAGLGTRLRPLTDELPKPLVPLGNATPLALVAERLAAAGISRAVVNVHHRPEAFDAATLAGLPLAVTLQVEPEILGTAGGLAGAATSLGPGEVVVWNGDILVDLDVGGLLAAAAEALGAGALSMLAVAPRPAGEGTVGLDAGGRVVRLRGERFGEEARGGDFVGVQVIGEALRRRLPARGCLVGDAYLPALRLGEALASFEAPGTWTDVGTVASYLEAHRRWLEARGERAFVGAGASVGADVRLEESVVGRGAKVTGRGALARCVVWPGARAAAPLADAVVTPRGVVARG